MQGRNIVDIKDSPHDLQLCSRCKSQSVDLTTAYTCSNCHYMCHICLHFLAKTEEKLMCPKCNHKLENAYNVRRTRKLYRRSPYGVGCDRCQKNDLNVSPGKPFIVEEDPSSFIQKSQSRLKIDEMKNTIYDSDKSSGKKLSKENILRSKLESREETSEEESGSCQSDLFSNPLMFSYNTYRPYVVPARPVVCPITMCGKNVAATGFISHFEFDHRDVAMLVVTCGEAYTIIFNPDQVEDDFVGCICLFTLTTMGKPNYSGPNLEHKDGPADKDGSKTILVPFTMMISKLYLKFDCAYDRGDAQNKLIKKCNAEPLAFLLIWVCGFDANPEVYYSLEATYNNYRTQACIYSGPVSSLREQQDPQELFRKGTALILSPGLTASLCEDSGSLDINVTFH